MSQAVVLIDCAGLGLPFDLRASHLGKNRLALEKRILFIKNQWWLIANLKRLFCKVNNPYIGTMKQIVLHVHGKTGRNLNT